MSPHAVCQYGQADGFILANGVFVTFAHQTDMRDSDDLYAMPGKCHGLVLLKTRAGGGTGSASPSRAFLKRNARTGTG